ncbi:MAG: response regulator [Rickettsiales bacterium]
MDAKIKVLCVDDEPANLDILTFYLTEAGYEVITANDGDVGFEALEQHTDVEIIVLDRMMPRMNGIDLTKKIKLDKRFRDKPIIMQTAAASSEQVLEGIKSGVYYYLTKPYEDTMLLGIIRNAYDDAKNKRTLLEEVRKQKRVLGLMETSRFHFQTLEDARNLAYFIANCLPDPEAAVYGLSELLINAVEHGNLGITYNEKTKLVKEGGWHKEIDRRLQLPEYKDKLAFLSFDSKGEFATVQIQDQGNGFEWQKYETISTERATDPHGRGIALAKQFSFHTMEYRGNGNDVICTFKLEVEEEEMAA